MRLKKAIRGLTAAIASFTIVASPVANAAATATAAAKRERLMYDYLKMTGLSKKTPPTIGEFYFRFRQWYPEPIRAHLDQWVLRHKDRRMPRVDAQKVTDAEGRLQYRLLLQDGGKTITLTTGEDFVKIGAVKLDAKAYYNPLQFATAMVTEEPYLKKLLDKSKPVPQKPDIVLNREEFARLKKGQRALYFLQLRETLMEAERILDAAENFEASKPGKKTSALLDGGLDVVARWAMGLPAFAKVRAGDACVVAGFPSVYGENLSCGGKNLGQVDFKRQVEQQFAIFNKAQNCSSGVPCNPMVYGFDAGGGAHCVPSSVVSSRGSPVTAHCNSVSPLADRSNKAQRDADRRRIVQSWVKAMGDDTQLQFDENGKILRDQYPLVKDQLEALKGYIKRAKEICDGESGRGLRKERADQDSACKAIEVRMFALQDFKIEPPPEPPRPPEPICTSDEEIKEINGEKQCVQKILPPLPPPDPAPKAPPEPAEPPDDEPITKPPPKKAEEECGWWCRNGTSVLIGGGLLVGIGLFAWWMTKDKGQAVQPPQYVPPIPPPLPPVTTTPPVTVPPPPPPPPPLNEGGTGTPPVNGGGVRSGNR